MRTLIQEQLENIKNMSRRHKKLAQEALELEEESFLYMNKNSFDLFAEEEDRKERFNFVESERVRYTMPDINVLFDRNF
jgi:hypothetical protein